MNHMDVTLPLSQISLPVIPADFIKSPLTVIVQETSALKNILVPCKTAQVAHGLENFWRKYRLF